MKLTRPKLIASLTLVLAAAGAIAFFNRSDDSNDRSSRLTTARTGSAGDAQATSAAPSLTLDQWMQKVGETHVSDFRSLIDAAMKISDPEMRNAVVTSIVDRWMLEDSTAFIKYIAALQVNGADESMAILALALQDSLTKLDPARAASDEVLLIVQRLIDYLAVTDPEMALVWAKKWLLDDTLENAMVAIVRGLAKADITKALAVIDQMKSPLRRSQALATAGAVWAMRDPAAALAWAMKLPLHSERALTLNSVLLAVSQQNLSSAAQALQQQAQQMTDEYKSEREKDLASRGVTAADEANDSETYREMLAAGTLPPPASPDAELLSPSGTAIGKDLAIANGGPSAVNYAESIENDYLKLKTLSGALAGWATTDPQAALAYAAEKYPGNSDLITSIYSSWASVDSSAAAHGVGLISDPAQRAIALETVVKKWATSGDPFEAASYLETLPPSEASDGTKAALVNAMAQQSPQKAWQIATTITNESAQFRALKDAFANLVIQNPSEANTLLAATSLPTSTSDRLRDMLDAVVGN